MVLLRGTETTHPTLNDDVTIRAPTLSADGSETGKPPSVSTFLLRSELNSGWSEAIQLMVVGEKRRIWVPAALTPSFVPQARVFDLELLALHPAPPPPPTSPPADALRTPDGLATKVTKPGTGRVHPEPADGVRVSYAVWRDGRLVQKFETPTLRGVISMFEAWSIVLPQMVEGETRIVWVPEGRERFHEDATLVIELVEIIPAPRTPADVRAAPRDAIVAKSGLVSKVVARGAGTVHPAADGQVAVQLVAWTPSGQVVDSSYGHGPLELRLSTLTPRFAELLELMTEGETRRVWTKDALIRSSVPGTGALVYEVQLVRVGPPTHP
jgi:peptidylprolyl isomerase